MYAHHDSINGVHLSEMVFLIVSLLGYLSETVLLKDHLRVLKILAIATHINACDEPKLVM
jgi:hypothetical protein